MGGTSESQENVAGTGSQCCRSVVRMDGSSSKDCHGAERRSGVLGSELPPRLYKEVVRVFETSLPGENLQLEESRFVTVSRSAKRKGGHCKDLPCNTLP